MLALFDFIPKACPSCGAPFSIGGLNLNDWLAHCSCECAGCGLLYQLADSEAICSAATASSGDLERYAS